MNSPESEALKAFEKKFDEFCDEQNSIRRFQEFNYICNYLKSINDYNIVHGKVWPKCTEYAINYITSPKHFLSFIEILNKASDVVIVEKLNDNILRLMENAFYLSESDSTVISKSISYFKIAISNKKLSADFCNTGIFESVFTSAFTLCKDPNVSKYLKELVFECCNQSFFQSVSIKQLNRVFEIINNTNIEESLKTDLINFVLDFYFKSVAENPKNSEVLKKEGTIASILKFIDSFSEDQKQNTLEKLISSGGSISTDVIAQLLPQNTKPQAFISRSIINTADKFRGEVTKIQSIVPFSRWCDSDIDADEIINLISILQQADPSLISQCISPLINHLKPSNQVKSYIQTFMLIDNQLLRRMIKLSDLLQANFLNVFVIDAPEEYIIEFFKKSATFVQLILDVFSLCQDDEIHKKVIDKVFGLARYKDILTMLSTAISGFICVWPTSDAVNRVLNNIDRNKTGELAEGLISACTKSATVADLFVESGGIHWTLENFYESSMSVKQLTLILASISSHSRYDMLDESISELPHDHPLFHIPSDLVEPIVFGMKNLTFYREIRVTSMFHLLPDKTIIDPYNLWKIGKKCFDKLSDEDKHKLLPLVANRYILPEQVEQIIKTAPRIDSCCNPEFDHFPLFQFYPGQGEFSIDADYILLSFWFKLGDFVSFEMTIFKNELLTITIRDSTLTAEVEKQKCHAEISPVEWNLIVIRLEVGIMASSLHVNTKSDELIFQPKKKVTMLKKATFGSTNQTIVLLGSSIRFSKSWVSDWSVLESRGPGSMKPIEGIKESLQITALNVDINLLPKNCYNVHYFGLPRHLHNALHQQSLFKLLGDKEKAESALIAIANTQTITQNQLKHFIDRALLAIKEYQPQISSEIMKKQLMVLLSAYDNPKEEVFMMVFTDVELWEKVDNFTLLSTLLELFPNVIIKNIDSAELFLAERVLKNPTDHRLILLILNNFRKLTKTFKYIYNMLKSAPIIEKVDWDILRSRRPHELQISIAQCMADFISRENVDNIVSYVSFDELKYLMMSTKEILSATIYHLIATISFYIPGYMIIDMAFLSSICRLAGFPVVWEDTMKLAQRDQQRTVKNISVVPILLQLIWSCAVSIFHSKGYKLDKENLRLLEIEAHMNNALALLMDIVPKIVETPLCMSILLYYYPLIMNFPYVFINDSDESERPAPINFESMNLQTMSEYNDTIWSNLEIPKDLAFKPPKVPWTPLEYLRELIKEIFLSFDLPQAISEEQVYEIPETINWMKTNPLFIFMSDLLLKCSHSNFFLLARAFFIGTPFRYAQKPRQYAQNLLHILMSCMTVPLSPSIPFNKLFSFIHFLCGLNLLSDNAQQFISDILLLCSSIVWSFGEREILKYADQVYPILLQLMATAPDNQYEKIFGLLSKNSNILVSIVNQTKSHLQWIFFLSSFMNMGDAAKQLLAFNDVYETDKAKDSWGVFTSNFQKTFEDISKEIKSYKQAHFIDFAFISRETIKFMFISDCKSFVVGTMMNQALKYSNCVFTMLCDLRKWEVFRFRLMEKMRSSSNENPKDLFMSLKCLPYFPPKLLPPVAPNPGFDPFHKKHFIHRNACLPVFLRTFEKFGNPITMTSCVFIRYGDAIPSIFFAYQKSIVIVLFSTLKGDQMIMYDEYSSIFEESLLAGQIGKLYLFDNHFVIEVKQNDLLAIHCMKERMNIWSFSYGNFLLVFENEISGHLLNFVTKLDDEVTKTFLFDHLLDQIKTKEEATKRWHQKMISSFQYVCVLNALCGYSYSDINNFPCFPPFLNPPEEDPGQPTPFPSGCMVSMSLSRIMPFNKLPKTEIQSNSVIAPVYSLAEQTMDDDTNHDIFKSMVLRDSLESENARVELQQWTRVHFTTKPVRTNSLELPSKVVQQDTSKTPYQSQLPPLSGRTSVLKSAMVEIVPNEIKLEIIDTITGKCYVRFIDHAFDQALSVATSQNGLFLVVDFSFGETRAYRVIYENDLPSGLMVLNTFATPCAPRSAVSGSNWLCATLFNNKVVLWDIFNGLIHRTITFNCHVFLALFDVPQSHVWVLCDDNKIYCYTVNATFLCSLDLADRKYSDIIFISTSYCTVYGIDQSREEVLSFHVSSSKKCVKMRVLGEEDKSQLMQASLQQYKLKKILCGDAQHATSVFFKAKKHKRRASYEHCVICNNPAKALCRVCGKFVCEQCSTLDAEGPLCRNCKEMIPQSV